MRGVASRIIILLGTLVCVFAIGTAGCGEQEAGSGNRGRWHTVRVEGGGGATGLAELEGRLLVTVGARREILAIELEQVRKLSDVADAAVQVRRIPIDTDAEAWLSGGEMFAGRGYKLGDLWSQPIDMQGIAAQSPGLVFLAERTHRVAYVGRLVEAADGTWRSLELDRVFVLPGADRSASAASDWRDKGAGIAGMDAVQGDRRTEDLYVADRAGPDADTFRIHALDRHGLVLGFFTVRLRGTADPAVEALLRDDQRFIALRGSGRGLLFPVRRGQWRSVVDAGRGTPGPDVEGVDAWTGMAQDVDGTIYLVSSGLPTYVAWRTR